MTGLGLGIGIADREFDCILCGRHFSQMTADLILPEDKICAECLEKLWRLEGDTLREYLLQRLAKLGFQDKEIERIIKVIPALLERKQRLDELLKRIAERKTKE